MLVLDLGTVVSQSQDLVGNGPVVSQHRAAISKSAQVFSRIKAGGRGVSQAASRVASITRSLCLGCIFDYRQSVCTRNEINGFHVSGLAIKMYQNDGSRSRCDRGLYSQRIDVVGIHVRF